MSERIPRRQYTDDFKAQAVARSDSLGRTQAARQLNIPVKSLANRVDAARAGRRLHARQRKPVNELESLGDAAACRERHAQDGARDPKKSDGVLRQGVQVRYAFVARELAHYPVRLRCWVLAVSVSGFHAHLKRQAQPGADPDAALRADLHTIHAGSRGTSGRPRMVRALRACAHPVGPKRVARLMHEEGLRGRRKGPFRQRTTDSRHQRPVAENRLERRFAATSAPPAWVGDISYLPTQEGWLYLAVVISLQTRQVRGYSLSERMPDDLVLQAFGNAWSAAPANAGLLFHPDRGSQYASRDFRQLLATCGVIQSLSRQGHCWDNAVAESFLATLKNEEANHVYTTKAEAYMAIAHYIHGFYNPTRLHSALGYRSPNDYAKPMKQAA